MCVCVCVCVCARARLWHGCRGMGSGVDEQRKRRPCCLRPLCVPVRCLPTGLLGVRMLACTARDTDRACPFSFHPPGQDDVDNRTILQQFRAHDHSLLQNYQSDDHQVQAAHDAQGYALLQDLTPYTLHPTPHTLRPTPCNSTPDNTDHRRNLIKVWLGSRRSLEAKARSADRESALGTAPQ